MAHNTAVEPIEEIKSRLSIEDVVGRYVDLKRSGASYKGLCPFHGEKTPSFYVTPSRGTYHCFGCGKGGDIFSFLMETQHLAFPDALKELAQQAGVTLAEREQRKPSLKNRLYEANESAARLFADTLKSPAGLNARRYLEGRGFGPEAILLFDLGFAPEGRDVLVQALQKAGFETRILIAAGLAIQDESTGALRDRFRGRLMFPIRDAAGKITGFGGRAMGDTQPKYLNSPQTEIFDKSGVLFGVHRAREAMRKAGRAVLVEGYLDAVRAHVAGFANVVASLGTAVTAQQLTALSRLTDTVVLALDPDAAGQAAAARTGVEALSAVTQARGRREGSPSLLDLRIARLPEASGDPDELIRDRPEEWEALIDSAVPAFEFLYTQTLGSVDRSSDTWRQQAIDRLLPVIRGFGGSVGWQAQWLDRLARDTGTDARALQRSVSAGDSPGRAPSSRPRTRGRENATESSRAAVTAATAQGVSLDPVQRVEERLLAYLLKLVVVPDEAAELLRDWHFERHDHRALADAILAWSQGQNYDYQMFRETLPPELQERGDELLALDEPLPVDNKLSVGVAYYLARLRLFRIEVQLDRGAQLLADVESEDRPKAVADLARLMEERRETEQALDRLSQMVLQSTPANPLG